MGRYADPTEKAIRCPLKGHQRPLLACLACRHFPCRAMTEERLALLRTSPFVQLDTKNSKLLPRRHVMYIFRMTSGELRDAPEDFSPDAPDFEQLADVEEVLVIGKVLVKQLRLVAKPREERDRIREQLSTPDLPEEVEEAIREISTYPNVKIHGLMTIAPNVSNPEENRVHFRNLHKLLVDINGKNIDNINMNELSMGMTGDYEVAIEEGATYVRVGTGIFGNRQYL